MRLNYKKLAISIALPFIASAAGTLFTSTYGWYEYISKPAFSPPNWVFGPVWTTLYLLMGISLYIIWNSKAKKKKALTWYGIQLFLNAIWTPIFFGLQSPTLAFIDILLLWTAILITIISFSKISKKASYLLIPYIIWVTFAAILNLAIIALN
jgi:tryptophan-rich sensory protein